MFCENIGPVYLIRKGPFEKDCKLCSMEQGEALSTSFFLSSLAPSSNSTTAVGFRLFRRAVMISASRVEFDPLERALSKSAALRAFFSLILVLLTSSRLNPPWILTSVRLFPMTKNSRQDPENNLTWCELGLKNNINKIA